MPCRCAPLCTERRERMCCVCACTSQVVAGVVRALAYCHSRRVAHGSVDGALAVSFVDPLHSFGSRAAEVEFPPATSLLRPCTLRFAKRGCLSLQRQRFARRPSPPLPPAPLASRAPAHLSHSPLPLSFLGTVYLLSTYNELAPGGPTVRLSNFGFAVVGNEENGDELAEAARVRRRCCMPLLLGRSVRPQPLPTVSRRHSRPHAGSCLHVELNKARIHLICWTTFCGVRDVSMTCPSPVCPTFQADMKAMGAVIAEVVFSALASEARQLDPFARHPSAPIPLTHVDPRTPLAVAKRFADPTPLYDFDRRVAERAFKQSFGSIFIAQGCQAPTSAADMSRIFETVFSLDWPEARRALSAFLTAAKVCSILRCDGCRG